MKMRKLRKIVIIVLCLIILIKMFQIFALYKVNCSIKEFCDNSNWKVCEFCNYAGKIYDVEMYFKDNRLKIISDDHFEYYDFDKSQIFRINEINQQYSIKKFSVDSDKMNLLIVKNNDLDKRNILTTILIYPVIYDEKIAVKIVRKSHTKIIDIDTFLPTKYLCKNVNLDNAGDNIEYSYTYFYEVDTVTEEDVCLPDLSKYELIESSD